MYYYEHYADHVNAQNARNDKTRHIERNRTVDDLLKNNKTCPEESIYQIGTMEESVPPETVIRQIKRCLFRQIKTGLSEHLTMG